MREIISLNLRPGVVVYTTLLNAYGVSGDLAAAHKVLLDMKAAGVQPNNFTYSSLMTFHSQAGQVSSILVSLLCRFLHSVLYAFVLWCKWEDCCVLPALCFCCSHCMQKQVGTHLQLWWLASSSYTRSALPVLGHAKTT